MQLSSQSRHEATPHIGICTQGQSSCPGEARCANVRTVCGNINLNPSSTGVETPTCLSLAISILDRPMNAKHTRTRGPRELLSHRTQWLLNIFEDIMHQAQSPGALFWDSLLRTLLTGRGLCAWDSQSNKDKARCFFQLVDSESSLRRASFPPYTSSLFSTDCTAKRLSDGWILQGVHDFCVRYEILFRDPIPC